MGWDANTTWNMKNEGGGWKRTGDSRPLGCTATFPFLELGAREISEAWRHRFPTCRVETLSVEISLVGQ
jgi:hypothetical protein